MSAVNGRMPTSTATTHHFVRGLDSFRFIAAAVVTAGHGAWVPFDRLVGEHHGVLNVFGGVWGSLPNGTLAVCIFFFISGFCIHLPNVSKKRVQIIPFLVKRGLRIGTPLVVVVAAAHAAGRQYVGALDSVLWSVYCELAYYALYPLLFGLLRENIRRAIVISIFISAGLLVSFPATQRPFNFGLATFIFCAPMWLLGAQLAERYHDGSLFSWKLPSIWLLRGMLPVCAVLATLLFYYGPKLPLTWAVAAFTPIGYLWLAKELQQLTSHRTNDRLEALGKAAYSIYLVHRFPLTAFYDTYGLRLPVAAYMVQALAISLCAWEFYRLVEKPSHELSKTVGRRVSKMKVLIEKNEEEV